MSSLTVAVTEAMASKLVGAADLLSSHRLRMSKSGGEQGTDPEDVPFHVYLDNEVVGRVGYCNVN